VPTEAANSAAADAANAAGAAAAANGTGEGVAGPAGAQLQHRTIYFDFDSSEIKAEFADTISAHAHYLASNASIRVRLEGNTDERGSREYNIGLGERRAQAVRRALMLQGVTEAQITTVSYGEERPAVTGHTEEAWARNRRVELVYLN
jgi:peptidoglycan-associated lipoprotein